MITLTDQLDIVLPLPTDNRFCNLVLTGNIVKIETISEYLERVDISNRYLGLEVIISTPPGEYTIESFLSYMQLGSIQFAKYKFVIINDLTLVYDSVVIINELTTGGISEALSAEQGVILKNLIDSANSSFISLDDTPNSYTGHKDKIIKINDAEDGIDFINRTFIYNQGLPSEIWTILHNLNKFPSVSIKNSAGDIVEGFINYIDENNIVITFNSAFSGSAVLN